MEIAVNIIKYLFVAAFAVEGILIVRAIVALAREKLRKNVITNRNL